MKLFKQTATFIILTFGTMISFSQEFHWAKNFGGENYDGANSVCVDSQGNVYSTGYFYGTADFDPGDGIYELTAVGEFDVYITKLDPNGEFVWAGSMGGIDYDYGYSIATDSDDNVYVAGYYADTADFDPGEEVYELTANGWEDIFIMKLDVSGNFIWAKSIGGPDFDGITSLTTDSSGNVYATGGFNGTADFDPGEDTYDLISWGAADIFALKLNPNGDFIWAKNMGGLSQDFGQSVTVDEESSVYITGNFQSPAADFDPGNENYPLNSQGNNDIFMMKLDTSGNFVWAKNIGGDMSDFGAEIIVNAGNVYATGFFDGTLDFDPGEGVYELTSEGDINSFVIKMDTAGDFIWAKNFRGTNDNYSQSIAVDSEGNVFTSGWFYETIDFDPGDGVYELTSAGEEDVFISKLTASGDFAWAISIGGESTDAVYGIYLDETGNLYTTGYFYGTVDFDQDEGVYEVTSSGDADIFIMKLQGSVLSVNENTFSDIVIYPNPTTGIINLQTKEKISSVSVYNSAGQKVSFKSLNKENTSIDLSNLSSGVYFVEITLGNKTVKRYKVVRK